MKLTPAQQLQNLLILYDRESAKWTPDSRVMASLKRQIKDARRALREQLQPQGDKK